jgi:putative two-component system response regulator/two-component system glycerol uptake and utilization response regulator
MERKSVLVADDDKVFVAAVTAVLQSRYSVRTAFNGKEALEQAKQDPPDLIVLDVMMDYMSEGFDVARKLRTNPETKTIPLIMLTGVDRMYNYRLEQDESWVPCDRYLEKPIGPETLLAEVEALLKSPRP